MVLPSGIRNPEHGNSVPYMHYCARGVRYVGDFVVPTWEVIGCHPFDSLDAEDPCAVQHAAVGDALRTDTG